MAKQVYLKRRPQKGGYGSVQAVTILVPYMIVIKCGAGVEMITEKVAFHLNGL